MPAPQDADAYFERGNTHAEEAEHDKAIAEYAEAIRLDPTSAKAYNNRGNSYTENGEYDKAWADVKASQRSGGEVDAEFLVILREASGG